MPELPEVETVKEALRNCVLGKVINSVDVYYEKILENISKDDFCKVLKGQKIIDIDRYGKYLIFKLSKGFIVSHLRMEGKYHYDMRQHDKHTHIVFNFEDETNLAYHDVRKFGKMNYFDLNTDIYNVKPLSKLGLEPFLMKDGTKLYEKLKKCKKPIKQVLLDQEIIAGIGNIYADEICFYSKISPFRLACDLSKYECDLIVENAKKVLTFAIKLGGSTVKSYQSAHGIDGKFQNELAVYSKQGQTCKVCGSIIVKTKIAQRGTHYCPKCQEK